MEQDEKQINAENEQSNIEKDDQEEFEVIDTDVQDEAKEDNGLNKLQNKLDEAEKEKDEVYQRMLRLQAEFDNFKKRTQKEKEASLKYKAQDLASELLPAIDNFERALQVEPTDETKGIIDGITMVYNQLKDALKSAGVEEIETIGKEFDPNLHHAVMQIEDEDSESNTVVEELQKGYILKDRVIRPAMVKVNK